MSFCELLHLDLNRLVRTYTRGQLAMISHASRILYRPGKEAEEDPEAEWLRTADTRKMDLPTYQRFMRAQQDRWAGRH